MPSVEFKKLCKLANEIHERKNHDYAQEDNHFSNFERASIIASWFDNPVHKSFALLIGIKLARAAELLNGKTPKNESVDDTMLDNFVYAGLFAAYIKEKR